MKKIVIVVLFILNEEFTVGSQFKVDLPYEHLPYYFNTFRNIARECTEDSSCPFKQHLDKNVCWGYEDDCGLGPRSYSHPICDGDHKGWVKTKKEQVESFFKEGDFGYVKEFRNSFKPVCKPQYKEDSSLECTENLTFCRARNIIIDFRDLINRTTPVMYDMDVLKAGEIGGYCDLDNEALRNEMSRMSALQSWSPELQHFVQLKERPLAAESKLCDRIIETPTFIMKIDATVNLYHHFCDFFNLYASLHVNLTSNNPDAFSRSVRVLIWRTYKYHSNFEAAFRAFTTYPIQDLNDVKGKRVCFKNAVFPLLPRMIFGLYYNTPLVWGCSKSGLFHAFSKFMFHRLGVSTRLSPNEKKIRITLLSRQTKFRRILNENTLMEAMEQIPNVIVKKVVFTWKTDFLEQLREIQETDVLIGIHGAGLTHLLFLPDWAAIFEVYNCEDEHCYSDLARLRGVKYITWNDRTKLTLVKDETSEDIEGNSAKHVNYKFDPDEFIRLVKIAVEYVKNHETGSLHDEL